MNPATAQHLAPSLLAALLRSEHPPDAIVWRTEDAALTAEQAAVAMETGTPIGKDIAAWMAMRLGVSVRLMRLRALPRPEALLNEQRTERIRLRLAEEGYLSAHGWTTVDGEAWADPASPGSTIWRGDAVAAQRGRVPKDGLASLRTRSIERKLRRAGIVAVAAQWCRDHMGDFRDGAPFGLAEAALRDRCPALSAELGPLACDEWSDAASDVDVDELDAHLAAGGAS